MTRPTSPPPQLDPSLLISLNCAHCSSVLAVSPNEFRIYDPHHHKPLQQQQHRELGSAVQGRKSRGREQLIVPAQPGYWSACAIRGEGTWSGRWRGRQGVDEGDEVRCETCERVVGARVACSEQTKGKGKAKARGRTKNGQGQGQGGGSGDVGVVALLRGEVRGRSMLSLKGVGLRVLDEREEVRVKIEGEERCLEEEERGENEDEEESASESSVSAGADGMSFSPATHSLQTPLTTPASSVPSTALAAARGVDRGGDLDSGEEGGVRAALAALKTEVLGLRTRLGESEALSKRRAREEKAEKEALRAEIRALKRQGEERGKSLGSQIDVEMRAEIDGLEKRLERDWKQKNSLADFRLQCLETEVKVVKMDLQDAIGSRRLEVGDVSVQIAEVKRAGEEERGKLRKEVERAECVLHHSTINQEERLLNSHDLMMKRIVDLEKAQKGFVALNRLEEVETHFEKVRADQDASIGEFRPRLEATELKLHRFDIDRQEVKATHHAELLRQDLDILQRAQEASFPNIKAEVQKQMQKVKAEIQTDMTEQWTGLGDKVVDLEISQMKTRQVPEKRLQDLTTEMRAVKAMLDAQSTTRATQVTQRLQLLDGDVCRINTRLGEAEALKKEVGAIRARLDELERCPGPDPSLQEIPRTRPARFEWNYGIAMPEFKSVGSVTDVGEPHRPTGSSHQSGFIRGANRDQAGEVVLSSIEEPLTEVETKSEEPEQRRLVSVAPSLAPVPALTTAQVQEAIGTAPQQESGIMAPPAFTRRVRTAIPMPSRTGRKRSQTEMLDRLNEGLVSQSANCYTASSSRLGAIAQSSYDNKRMKRQAQDQLSRATQTPEGTPAGQIMTAVQVPHRAASLSQ